MYIHSTDLKLYLKEKRLSQTEIADGAKVSKSSVSLMTTSNVNLIDDVRVVRFVFQYLLNNDPDFIHLLKGNNTNYLQLTPKTVIPKPESDIEVTESICLGLVKSEILKLIQNLSADIILLSDKERSDVLMIVDICKS